MRSMSITWVSRWLAILLVVLAPTAWAEKTYHIAIISSGESDIYQSVITTIKTSIENSTALSITCELLDVDNPAHAVSNANVVNEADLLLTIGRNATAHALRFESPTPLLATLIPSNAFAQVLRDYQKSHNGTARNISAIYLDNPTERQILLSKILLGERKRIGILSTELNSDIRDQLVSFGKRNNLVVNIDSYQPDENIIKSLSETLGKSDVLLTLPDPVLYNKNTIRSILLTAYRHRVPLIGFSKSYVEAGALAAVYSSPEQIATQTSETIFWIFSNGGEKFTRAFPRYYSIAVNTSVAKSLGINVPPVANLEATLAQLLGEQK